MWDTPWTCVVWLRDLSKKEPGTEAKLSYLGKQVRWLETAPGKQTLEPFNYEDWHLLPRATFNEPGVWGVCDSWLHYCQMLPSTSQAVHCSVIKSYDHMAFSHFLFTQEQRFLPCWGTFHSKSLKCFKDSNV